MTTSSAAFIGSLTGLVNMHGRRVHDFSLVSSEWEPKAPGHKSAVV